MKAVACTRNTNFDEEAYRVGVIEPARRLREMGEALGERPPQEEQVREALSLLVGIFETKGVEREERVDRLQEIVGLHGLGRWIPDPAGLIEAKEAPRSEAPPPLEAPV
jgi:hypothetical protein